MSAALLRSSLWEPLKSSCGGNPTLIGRCRFDRARRSSVPVSFNLLDRDEEPYSFVLYHPHPPNSLRFFALSPPQTLFNLSPPSDPFRAIAKYDFTSPHPINLPCALNATLLNQVSSFLSSSSSFQPQPQLNASFIIQNAVKSRPNPKLLPITATFLLALASHLTLFTRILLWFSRLAASFVRIPVFPEPRLAFGPSHYLPLKDISATSICIFLGNRFSFLMFFFFSTTVRRPA